MRTMMLALSAPAIGTIGQLLLKHVMQRVGPIGVGQLSSSGGILMRLARDPLFLVAVVLYALGFVVWLVVLSKLSLSYAYPLLALSYCLVPVLSVYFFGEQVPLTRWIGIAIICVGVGVVGLSN
ncbi:MAG TPA: EamA family transporter [Bryobacteraceae bacterium]|nr:EamA family transporter [Bryobacteraceae bacterium]HZU43573.1 EamA family transporter [Terriglobales bacterium]